MLPFSKPEQTMHIIPPNVRQKNDFNHFIQHSVNVAEKQTEK